MQRISLAPELSATLSRVSCWITCLLRLLHDLEHAPANLFRDGLCLGDPDKVAHSALVLLVVDLELRAPLHRLTVEAVGLRRPSGRSPSGLLLFGLAGSFGLGCILDRCCDSFFGDFGLGLEAFILWGPRARGAGGPNRRRVMDGY